MGLDMFAYKVPKKNIINDFKFKKSDDVIEFAYWRKHNHLHGWFYNLYHLKGGVKDFDLVPLRLRTKDLNQLEEDIKYRNLLPAKDFFYKYDLEFIENARKAIQDGYAVYYNSWW